MKNCVIYKITNPSLHAYIGKSIDWETRYSKYKSLNCKAQPVLYRFFIKYGFESHTFEILMENVPEKQLSAWEIVWIWAEGTFENGLNCTKGGDGFLGEHTEASRQKMSNTKLRDDNPWRGRHHTEETKIQMSEARIGTICTEESKIKMSKAKLGVPRTKGIDNHKLKKSIICIETGIIYSGVNEASRLLKINRGSLSQCLNKKKKYPRSGGFHWEFVK